MIKHVIWASMIDYPGNTSAVLFTGACNFNCDYCYNKTLKGAPKEVSGNFDCSDCDSLKTLEGAPEKVGRNFDCSYCYSLTSLKGAPEKVGEYLGIYPILRKELRERNLGKCCGKSVQWLRENLEQQEKTINSGDGAEEIEIQYGTGVKKVKATETDVALIPHIPVVSHEIGQYSFFPDV